MQTTITIIAAATMGWLIALAVRVQLAQRADDRTLRALRIEADERLREEYERLNP